MRTTATLLAVAVTALVFGLAGTSWAIAGVRGPAYMAFFAVACLPGLPLGFALFGRGHFGAWIAGAILGYAITSFGWWAVIFGGRPSTGAFLIAWAVAGISTLLVARRFETPCVALPARTRRDLTALVLVLIMVPALTWRPLARFGQQDADGNRLYRAYFTADFVWHVALTAELAKQEPIPRNPFLAAEPLHYYWAYFRVPATVAAQTGMDVQAILKLNAVATALLCLAAMYFAAWAALPRWPFATAFAVALTTLAPSAEGFAAIVDLLRRGHPLSELRDLNIDAVAAWAFKSLRIDNLPRVMWYTPQHAFSCALGLLALPVVIVDGSRARTAAIVLAGCALASSLAFSPLLGVAFCGMYGVTVVADVWRRRGTVGDLMRHALAALPVALAVAWSSINLVWDGAGAVLHWGFWGPARNATVLNLLLQLGPVLLLLGVGLWPRWAGTLAPFWPAAAGVTIALLMMHLVTVTVDQSWVGFRGGDIFFTVAPALVARGLAGLWNGHRRAAILLGVAVLAAGLPTTVIDAYNAQDVANRHVAPGAGAFHWTVVLTPAEQEALDWIRTHTPASAVVQNEPVVRGRETWSLIPTFAERRMATGNPLALLARPIYAERNAHVQEMFGRSDVARAWRDAGALGIDYLYVDATERAAYPSVTKFDRAPDLFEPVFRNAEVVVYALRR